MHTELEPQRLAESPKIRWNGRFTVKNSTTGEHRTFQIKTQPDDSKFAPGKRIVALLTGPNNEGDYTPFAFCFTNGIIPFSKKRAVDGKPWTPFQWYADMLNVLLVEGHVSRRGKSYEGYGILIERRCRVCNRTLTRPESIESGIGPVCAGRG